MKSLTVAQARRLPHISWLRLLATFLLAFTVLAVVVDIALWAGQRFRPPPVSFIEGQAVFVAEMFYAVSYAAMGWLLATRLPRNLLGWIFLVLGAAMATQLTITFLVQEGHQTFRPLSSPLLLSAWFSSSFHLPALVVLTSIVFLRFPTGKLLSLRWGVAGWLTFIGAVLVALGVGLSPIGLAWYPSLPNPMAAPHSLLPVLEGMQLIGLGILIVGVLLATASMVVRYRASADVQRAQMRWIAIAVVLLAGAGVPFMILRYGLQAPYSTGHLAMAAALMAGCFLPVAAAVAILRHRLYDIDLILNRALVYIPLTGILGGLYAAGVALFQRLFQTVTGDKSDAAVVITTLVLAGMFTPIRNWLQSFVDRRFKPVAPLAGGLVADEALTVEQRVALLESRLARMEVGADPRYYDDP